MNKTLFFCFGPPKSGTTFLQRTLNLHPEISCPSEHQFDVLINGLNQLLEHYDNGLAIWDHRTGGQGITPLREKLHPKLFSLTVENMILEAAQGKKIAGANDNAIINKIELYHNLFHAPKFIAIFRNPIDAAISAWHHNMKLAEEEKNEQHKLIMTRHGGIEDWIKVVSKGFSNSVEACVKYRENNANLMIVKYEDLIENKAENLQSLFDFLGASTSKNIIKEVIIKSSFSEMKKASKRQDFFRSGKNTMGKGVVTEKLLNEVKSIASNGLDALHYQLNY